MEENVFSRFFRRLMEALRFSSGESFREDVDPAAQRRSEAFTVRSDGLTIRGTIYFPSAHPDRLYPVLVICHGIPSGAPPEGDDPGYPGLAREFTALGIAAVIFNFRGCGDSDGNFDMIGWTRDLDAVLDTIANTPHVDPSRILILGFSAGGAAAIKVAAENSHIFACAIAGTPAHFDFFTGSPQEIVDDFRNRGIIRDADFPENVEAWLKGFDEIEPLRWVPHYKPKDLFIVHGDRDELVPVEHARELEDKAPAGIARLTILPGAVHHLRRDPRCIDTIKDRVLRTLGWKHDR